MMIDFELLAQTTNGFYGMGGMGRGGMGGISMMYWVIIGGTMLASTLASWMLKSKFKKYSKVPVSMTGAQVAEKMLRAHGITDVKVISVGGRLTDHYDPRNKTVNLSEPVYGMKTVAAAAVASHEVGHAVQDAKAYAMLGLRSRMVPAVSIGSKMSPFLLMIGAGMAFNGGNSLILMLGVAAFAVTTLFSFVTLPVEFDASRRAMAWIGDTGFGGPMGKDGAKDALFWAAMTYVVAALGSLAQLLYWGLRLMSSRR